MLYINDTYTITPVLELIDLVEAMDLIDMQLRHKLEQLHEDLNEVIQDLHVADPGLTCTTDGLPSVVILEARARELSDHLEGVLRTTAHFTKVMLRKEYLNDISCSLNKELEKLQLPSLSVLDRR